jgi:hypothetical protein
MQITNVMIFGGVLILVILMMMVSDNIVPYSRSSSTLNEYVYEGMRQMQKRNTQKSVTDSTGDGVRIKARESIMRNLDYMLSLSWTGGNKQHNINRTKEIRRIFENDDEKINLCDINDIVKRYKPNSDKLNEVNTIRDLKDDIDTYTRINQTDTNKKVSSIISDIQTVADATWDFKQKDNAKVSSDIRKILSDENTFNLCVIKNKLNSYQTNNSEKDKVIVANLDKLKDTINQRISIAKTKAEAFTNISDIPVQTIDVFSTSVGSPTCVGKSSGLSNSTGSLCLTDNMMQMLQTRGGNSTGPDSQIGGQ